MFNWMSFLFFCVINQDFITISSLLEVTILTVFTLSKQWGSFAFQSLQFVLIFNRKQTTDRKDELHSINILYPWNKPEFFFFFFWLCEREYVNDSLFYPPEGHVVLKCPQNFIYREMLVLEPVFERRWWRMLVTMSPHIYQEILDRIAISFCLLVSSLDKQRWVV